MASATACGQVHFIGEISGAEGFGSGISCRFRVEGGRHWTCLAGSEEGQTHVVYVDRGESCAVWNHPLDLHYATKSIQARMAATAPRPMQEEAERRRDDSQQQQLRALGARTQGEMF